MAGSNVQAARVLPASPRPVPAAWRCLYPIQYPHLDKLVVVHWLISIAERVNGLFHQRSRCSIHVGVC
jgi:hypothetical protein